MLDDMAALRALRAIIDEAVAATTGSAALAATTDGYTRAAGSFLDDGFYRGMEIQPTGFADNPVGVVQYVDDSRLIVGEGVRGAETEAGGRSIVAAAPALRAWENVEFKPTPGRWYLEEDYMPGPSAKTSVGIGEGTMQIFPAYVLRVYGVSRTGPEAMYSVARALLNAYTPGRSLPLPAGNNLQVRTDPAPFRGQLVTVEGRPVITLTIGLWALVTTAAAAQGAVEDLGFVTEPVTAVSDAGVL